jgi:hypothetical protein
VGRRAFIIAILCARLLGCVELEKKPDPPGSDISASGVVCIYDSISNDFGHPEGDRPKAPPSVE